MKDRIAEIIRGEGLTSQQFAEKIEMQSSTISHILAGRNLPSFKIIYNLLEKFPNVNPDWLIFGKGDMYRVRKQDINHNNLYFNSIKEIDEVDDSVNDIVSDDDLFSLTFDKSENTNTITNVNNIESNISSEKELDIMPFTDDAITNNSLVNSSNNIPIVETKSVDNGTNSNIMANTSTDNHSIVNKEPKSAVDIEQLPIFTDVNPAKVKKIVMIYEDDTFEILIKR